MALLYKYEEVKCQEFTSTLNLGLVCWLTLGLMTRF